MGRTNPWCRERERETSLMFHVFEKKTKNTRKKLFSQSNIKNQLPEKRKKEKKISKNNVLSRKQDMQRKDAEYNKNKEARRNVSEKDVSQGSKRNDSEDTRAR